MADKTIKQEDLEKLFKINPLAEAQLTAIQNKRIVEELEEELKKVNNGME